MRSLGCYDAVLAYGQLDTLPPRAPTMNVEFAVSTGVRSRVHGHFAGALRFSSSISGKHWSALRSTRNLPGPRPVLFFAPAKVSVHDWGAHGALARRIGSADAREVLMLDMRG